jgi:hypothetical protein
MGGVFEEETDTVAVQAAFLAEFVNRYDLSSSDH